MWLYKFIFPVTLLLLQVCSWPWGYAKNGCFQYPHFWDEGTWSRNRYLHCTICNRSLVLFTLIKFCFLLAEEWKKRKTFFSHTSGSLGNSVMEGLVTWFFIVYQFCCYCSPLTDLLPTHPSSLIVWCTSRPLVHSFHVWKALVGLWVFQLCYLFEFFCGM